MTPLPHLKTPPSPKEIDGLIAQYAAAQSEAAAMGAVAKLKSEAAGVLKAELTAWVESYGGRHTEKSKRLAGLHHTATTTTATRVSIDDAAVETLRGEIPAELSEKFFVEHVSYSLVAGPQDVLKTLTLTAKLRVKITRLLHACFQIKTNAPSLKVELAEISEDVAA